GGSNRLAGRALRHRRARGAEANRIGGASRYQSGASGGSGRRADKQIPKIDGIVLETGAHFQHDVILVQLREHGGDFTLPVSVVQRVVDGGGRDAQARGGI